MRYFNLKTIFFRFVFLISLTTLLNVNAQTFFKIGLNIGDTVPPLKVQEWLKGEAIHDFDKEKIYIVDFWATWCGACMTTMPHLSQLARKYRDKAEFLAIHIYENSTTSPIQIKKVVQAMGTKMDFSVATQKDKLMAINWVDTSESRAIPTAFIIKGRKIEWIGDPRNLDSILVRVINNKWDRDFALLKRNNEIYLNDLQFKALEILLPKLERYVVNIAGNTYDRVRISPDSSLTIINDMVHNIPDLKFLPTIASITFEALLRTDISKALQYAKDFIASRNDPHYLTIIQNVEDNTGPIKISADIYELTADCYQLQIKNEYPDSTLVPSLYKKMANMYRLSGNIEKALAAEQKADRILKMHF